MTKNNLLIQKGLMVTFLTTAMACAQEMDLQTENIQTDSHSQQGAADDPFVRQIKGVSAKLYTDGRRADVSLRVQKYTGHDHFQHGTADYCGFSKDVCDRNNCINKPEGAVPEHVDDYFADWDGDGLIGTAGDPTLIDFYPYPQELVIDTLANGIYSIGIDCHRDCQDRAAAVVVDFGEGGTFDLSTLLGQEIDVLDFGRAHSNFSHMFTFFVHDGKLLLTDDYEDPTPDAFIDYMMTQRQGFYGAETCVYYEPQPVFPGSSKRQMHELCVDAYTEVLEADEPEDYCWDVLGDVHSELCRINLMDYWNCVLGRDDSFLPEFCPQMKVKADESCL